jgi:serine protease
MKSVDPSLSPSLLDALLVAGSLTTDLGPIGRDNRYGYGLIDAQKALLAAQAGVVPTTLTVNPNTVNLGTDLNSAVLNAQKFGPFQLEITDVSDDADWLTVTEAQVDANGLGQYIVSVDRTGLDAGLYSALITFESTENTVTIPINLVIPYTIAKPHVGNHYVLLLDPNTYATRYQVQVQSENGFYQYRFTDVAPGDYIIFAGTNLDQDRFIGDEGESAGAYLSLDTPVVISVDGNQSELHFSTEFNINVSQNRTLIPDKALILPD